ncbi:MAG: glycosyltransferase [Deltaproteobacteria bacterium]|nr:glycosyltransferase [Deltaproteobacteria bacterium]
MAEANRVVIIVDRFPTGTETFIRRHVVALNATVFARSMGRSDLDDWSGPLPEVLAFRRSSDEPEGLVGRAGRRLREMASGSYVPEWPPDMQESFDRLVRQKSPTVALAEFGPSGVCALEACRRHRIPLVVHFHGYDASSMLRLDSYRERLPALFDGAAAVVAVSHSMRARLVGLGCPSAKLHVIPCGAPVSKVSASPWVTAESCRFLAVGSMTPVKGPLLTLRGFRRCVRRFPEVSMTMIGGGALLAAARRWVRRHGLSSRVSLLGARPFTEVLAHLLTSSAFVQHSITTRVGAIEGWGVSLAEAAAAHLPIVATCHGGIPDQVIDGVTGFLVKEGDWRAMGDRMCELAEDPSLRARMGLRGRRHIEVVGDLELQVNKLREVLGALSGVRGAD